jgi:hypothetical protein
MACHSQCELSSSVSKAGAAAHVLAKTGVVTRHASRFTHKRRLSAASRFKVRKSEYIGAHAAKMTQIGASTSPADVSLATSTRIDTAGGRAARDSAGREALTGRRCNTLARGVRAWRHACILSLRGRTDYLKDTGTGSGSWRAHGHVMARRNQQHDNTTKDTTSTTRIWALGYW